MVLRLLLTLFPGVTPRGTHGTICNARIKPGSAMCKTNALTPVLFLLWPHGFICLFVCFMESHVGITWCQGLNAGFPTCQT